MFSRPRSVLVVDDSALVRQVISDVLEASDEFTVAGTASDGMDAIRKVHALDPDLVTLDVHMPNLDGLQALGYIMSEVPRPVIMLSALDSPSAGDLTIRALELGAVDFVRKPAADDALDVAGLRARLIPALRGAVDVNLRAASLLVRPRVARKVEGQARAPATRLVAIAASTGGPRALAEIIPALSGSLDAAVLIAQHMPAGFTASLAARLDRLAALPVREARHDDVLLSGHVYVAPGGLHLQVISSGGVLRTVVSTAPDDRGVRPSADRLLVSVADTVGDRAIGVVLTGMGRDGAEGLRRIRAVGGFGIVQDRQSCTVSGMPVAALGHAGADRVADLRDVARAILEAVALRQNAMHVTDVTRTHGAVS